MKQNYDLLRSKDIIAILDGDTQIEELDGLRIAMPYLSGPMLCELSQKFGYYQEYYWGNGSKPNLSRWQYMDNILEYVIKENKVNQLLSYMMDKERFSDNLRKLNNVSDIEKKYKYIIQKVLEQINSILYFGGHELVVINNQYIVKSVDEKINIDVPNINIVDRDYIKNLSERAMKDIDEGNLDSAITKSRTILEETFCYAIELKGKEPSDSGDIGKLYKQVKDLYDMHANKDMDKRINKLLSGLENIVQSIAEMRNNGSDSHGLGIKRINISDYHARLAVNSSTIMADFILSVSQNSK
ncbi:MAG: abortive infection family protein [Bacilli bacterium]|nr:abortive infection family protein [Bacilli bacterium]